MLYRSDAHIEFLVRLSVKSQPVVKTFSDCLYENYLIDGISFCFMKQSDQKFVLDAIHVYNTHNTCHFARFVHLDAFPRCLPPEFKLPFVTLTSTTSIRDIVTELAPMEPAKGRQGNRVWIRYDTHGLMVEFNTASWEEPTAIWTVLTLFIPQST